MLLSIIIPNYNLPFSLLKRALDSISNQEMDSDTFEVIVVDDSSKQPPLWVKEYKEIKNIELIISSHKGPGGARNCGLRIAKGDYIFFVDADDYLNPHSILACLALIKSERPQILRFDYKIEYNNDSAINIFEQKKLKYSYTESGASYMSKFNLNGSPWLYFFSRKLVTQHNIYFCEKVFHEDEEFNTKIHFFAHTCISCNILLYVYSKRDGSTTLNRCKEFEQKRIDNLYHLLKRLTIFSESKTETSNPIQKKGIERKITMLTVDTLLNLFYYGKSSKSIYKICNIRLRAMGLFPLPAKSYSLKYYIFRKLINTRIGTSILRLIIPRHKPKNR